MSGGSHNYLYRDVFRFAETLDKSPFPYRRAFANHLKLISNAMHDIECVDSQDYSDGDDEESIMKCITEKDIDEEVLHHAKNVLKRLEKVVIKMEPNKDEQ